MICRYFSREHSRNRGNPVVRRLPTVPDEAGQPSKRLVLFNKFRQLLMRKLEAVKQGGERRKTLNDGQQVFGL